LICRKVYKNIVTGDHFNGWRLTAEAPRTEDHQMVAALMEKWQNYGEELTSDE